MFFEKNIHFSLIFMLQLLPWKKKKKTTTKFLGLQYCIFSHFLHVIQCFTFSGCLEVGIWDKCYKKKWLLCFQIQTFEFFLEYFHFHGLLSLYIVPPFTRKQFGNIVPPFIQKHFRNVFHQGQFMCFLAPYSGSIFSVMYCYLLWVKLWPHLLWHL